MAKNSNILPVAIWIFWARCSAVRLEHGRSDRIGVRRGVPPAGDEGGAVNPSSVNNMKEFGKAVVEGRLEKALSEVDNPAWVKDINDIKDAQEAMRRDIQALQTATNEALENARNSRKDLRDDIEALGREQNKTSEAVTQAQNSRQELRKDIEVLARDQTYLRQSALVWSRSSDAEEENTTETTTTTGPYDNHFRYMLYCYGLLGPRVTKYLAEITNSSEAMKNGCWSQSFWDGGNLTCSGHFATIVGSSLDLGSVLLQFEKICLKSGPRDCSHSNFSKALEYTSISLGTVGLGFGFKADAHNYRDICKKKRKKMAVAKFKSANWGVNLVPKIIALPAAVVDVQATYGDWMKDTQSGKKPSTINAFCRSVTRLTTAMLDISNGIASWNLNAEKVEDGGWPLACATVVIQMVSDAVDLLGNYCSAVSCYLSEDVADLRDDGIQN